MKLIEELKSQSSDSKLALLIRHADRAAIPAGEMGNEILLTEKGKHNAFIYGNNLNRFKVNRIYSSPIKRCVQTAEFITKGYGKELEIVTTKSLGDPGLHITDEVMAHEFHLKYGFDEIYKRFMKGKAIPGVADAESYSALMTDFIKSNTQQQGLTLYVTHDSMIALYHFCLNRTVYTPQNWVNYLSGLALKK